MPTQQAIALVPGFLGFNHRRDRTYFADRFIAGIRSAVEARCGKSIAVVPFRTLPVGALARRQENLLRQLQRCDQALDCPQWHLVGHSTGGLDAALLARETKLVVGAEGTRFGDEPLLFPRLRSVTTLSAPHHGSTITLSPAVSLTRGQYSLGGIRDAVGALRDVVQRDQLLARLRFATSSLRENGATTILKFLFGDDLACDLAPSVASALTLTKNRKAGTPVASIATIAPPPNGETVDRFFRDLWTWTAVRADDVPPPPAVPTDPARVINSCTVQVPIPNAASNDGVVNTLRQVDGDYAALVVGDHGDVLGRYRRIDIANGDVIDPGLLTSEADFGNDEFFELTQIIAGCIAQHV